MIDVNSPYFPYVLTVYIIAVVVLTAVTSISIVRLNKNKKIISSLNPASEKEENEG